MARLLIKTGVANAPAMDLKWGVNRLGRAAGNDILIDHPSVSSAHCEVELGHEVVTVRDRGSTNGTFIDNQFVVEGELQAGQVLRLGAVEMVLEKSVAAVAIPQLQKAPASLVPSGATPCHNHAAIFATHKCKQCHKVFCDTCVHTIKRVGGRPLVLCPMCSGHTEPYDGSGKPKKKSFFAKLLDALKKPFQKRAR